MKLENCLFETKGSDYLKLADFGFSQAFKAGSDLIRMVGTHGYMSPEVLQGHYTQACDMWAVGVITVILLTARMPFHPRDPNMEKKLNKGDWSKVRNAAGDELSKNAEDFINKLLVVDTSSRLTAPRALQHPWIASRCPKKPARLVSSNIINSFRAFEKASHFRQACWTVQAWSLSRAERMTVRDAFMALDVHRTGTITSEEMRDVLRECDVSQDEVVKFFHALVHGRSGCFGYSDFLAAMCAEMIPLTQNHLEETFRRFDYDKTGYITESNLHHLFQTPMDDQAVNAYFGKVAGGGLSINALESVLRQGGGEVKPELCGKLGHIHSIAEMSGSRENDVEESHASL